MKRRMAMLVAVTAVSGVLVMFAPTGTAAQAEVHDACVTGNGTATLASPFHYPGLRSTTGTTTSAFHVHPHSTTFIISFNTPQCLTATSLHASGEVHGWCGLSIGSGVVHPSPLTPDPSFHWVGVGGTLVLTGEVSGEVTAIPDTLGGHSCASPTGASSFIVNGAAVSASCTGTVTQTSSSIASVSLGSTSVTTDHLHLSLGFASVNVSAPPGHTPANFHMSGHLHPRATVCVPDPT